MITPMKRTTFGFRKELVVFEYERGLLYRDGKKPDSLSKLMTDLEQAIVATIAPYSWEDEGGAASIDSWQPAEALVISQLEENHRRIERLLRDLRKALAAEKDEGHRLKSSPSPRGEGSNNRRRRGLIRRR